MKNVVKRHFIGLAEKMHRPPEYLEMLRFKVDHKVSPGIPFFKKEKAIVVLHAPAKVATQAPLLHPYGSGQGSNGL